MAMAESSETSLGLPMCYVVGCDRTAGRRFQCSQPACPGPGRAGPGPVALCDAHASRCPFCSVPVQPGDLHSVTDRPGTLQTSSDGRGHSEAEGAAAGAEHESLEEFNQHFERLANEVQKEMRELKWELASLASSDEHPKIAALMEQAEQLSENLAARSLQPDHITYQWVIKLYARAKNQEKVEQWALKMENSSCGSTEAYNSVIFCYTEPGCVDRAERWFEEMLKRELVPDVKSYSILMQACAKSRDSTRAQKYFNRMKEAGVRPNVVAFGHLVSAFAYEDHDPHSLRRAEAVWKDMQQAGVKPDRFIFHRLLKACANAGHARRASYFYNQSVEAGIHPDCCTFTTMITVFIKNGDVRGAEEWFGKMEEAGVMPDVQTFNSVISVCGTAGDVLSACRWLERLKAANMHPTWHTYDALIRSVLKKKDFEQAGLWLQSMLDSGVARDIKVFHTLLAACERGGDLLQAEKWFRAMEEGGIQPDVEAYNSMLRTSAVHDSSLWRRMKGLECKEQRKWFLQMCHSNVQPNEATHEILSRSAFPTSWAVLVAVAAASLSLLRRKSAAQ